MKEYPIPLEEIESYFPEPDPEMEDYFFHHVNYRIKDPKKTFKFYGELLGMRMVHHADCPELRTSVYHLGYYDHIPEELEERKVHCHHHESATIQFMYHWGTEHMDEVQYSSGNERVGKGFSHICIKVPDIDRAAQKLIDYGVDFINKPGEATLSGYCYFRDPDGYWVELLGSHVHPIPDGETKQEIIDAYQA